LRPCSDRRWPAARKPRLSRRAASGRILPRHDLTGEELGLLVDAVRYKLRIKDLSRTGLSGLTDAPLAPGQKVFLMFEGVDGHAAQICWIRNARMGAHFLEPLTAEELGRLRAHHRLRRRRAGTSSAADRPRPDNPSLTTSR
jgi:hypothetical protein